ncbi:MAG: disulfide bond formation protein DsbD [Flammeovirgaceae bacterium]|nr:disulfide bond formation protein DsbD [Flammeovirgaceae bacterium]|tara:strand:+ start:3743 stop:5701 length:1959 start_codon:yes stop_codon:yes gene_type:complete
MKNKFIVSLFIYLFLVQSSFSQILEPASWEFKIDSSELTSSGNINLIFIPTTELGWYIYSSDNDPDSGPRTEFVFNANRTYETKGLIEPLNVKTKYDEVWEAEVRYLDNEGYFLQKIIPSEDNVSISGYISYQVCSEIEKMCIPLEEDFAFYNSTVKVNISYDQSLMEFEKEKSLLSFVLFAFIAGLLAILTPCVFPMIPLTVSYFANKTNQKKSYFEAIIFGLSIMFIFTFLGVFLSLIMGPSSANEIATSWIPNLIFFSLFIIFGLSLIGFFELTIPSSIITSFDKRSQQGGILGVFFMAFTLVLVSFSCTGPLVGSILVQSASGLQIKPVLGMLSFSLAFAIPFTLLAIFPQKLHSLPKSGNWMIILRVVLGFIAIAFSLKFLSVVDKAYHFNLLSRDMFLIIWCVLFLVLSLYLLGLVKLPDGYLKNQGYRVRITAIFFLAFSLYLSTGLFGNRLSYFAAYLPPLQTNYFDLKSFSYKPFFEESKNYDEDLSNVKYSDILKLPYNLKGFFDYNEALNYAKKKNKPILLDFTGHGCVNCRDIESRVWPDGRVRDFLNNKYVLLSLYVDDKTILPENEWYKSTYDSKIKRTIGKQNADFQITRFNNNAQPFYVVIDPFSESIVYKPWGYELNIENYISHLDNGINEFYAK